MKEARDNTWMQKAEIIVDLLDGKRGDKNEKNAK